MKHQQASALSGAPVPGRQPHGLAIGSGFVAGASWAMELAHLTPECMASLILLARDLYPHDAVPDEFYAVALRDYDRPREVGAVGTGVEALDLAARGQGYGRYLDMPADRRAAVLREMPDSPFLQRLRLGLVTGLYAQPLLRPLL
ncbi:Twin-arginine translocation pathway signal [Salipiger sp. P9]|uniref:Twin-arginine translocation pathway signal n=1 Tax=Salipiger pentaromativorans TaxID=2943193 RepID=UPI00215797B2|nr:Twin-arginine translocation pathway signal [Salipiger pentaromativorans]MCR8550328.1 Twin-arginine translocation pathway signal [Salipiger pentaromativorans]